MTAKLHELGALGVTEVVASIKAPGDDERRRTRMLLTALARRL